MLKAKSKIFLHGFKYILESCGKGEEFTSPASAKGLQSRGQGAMPLLFVKE